ncbi:MAG: hypothetical protein HKL80_03470 [Acidimicrobiales bacterium]|nr:hypothetical protein [Acidimicrobiales bacterium]
MIVKNYLFSLPFKWPAYSHQLSACHQLIKTQFFPHVHVMLLGKYWDSFNPSPSYLPGSTQLQNLTNGIGAWALILSLAALVVGAAAWALGAHSQNYQHTMVGRRTVLVSAGAALLIGAAPHIVDFFYSTGMQV